MTLERIQFVGACNPPTDPGRKPLSQRFVDNDSCRLRRVNVTSRRVNVTSRGVNMMSRGVNMTSRGVNMTSRGILVT